MDVDGFYTAGEVAELFRVTKMTVTRLIKARVVRAARISGMWRIPVSEVERMMVEGAPLGEPEGPRV